ncbi:hypothetical protein PCANB_002710 [Pneumocystis canis]|nr:hypothetical protein PCK1_002790 [Pneumocystis canis]KAG5438604.1 hypothetical protein PCANB_002710 [Pneumocystis canis]
MTIRTNFHQTNTLSSPSSKDSNNDDFFSFKAIIKEFNNKSHERRKKKHNEIKIMYLKDMDSIEQQLKSIITKNKAKVTKQTSQKLEQLKHLLKRKEENEQAFLKEIEAIETNLSENFEKSAFLYN